jgi:DNA-binding winged helix-turn-helix (wHTH) protein
LFREEPVRWRFGDFTLDIETRQLRRRAETVHVSPKAFDLLAFLISRRPKMVSKQELIDLLWSDTFVVEANLSNLVSEIRAALDDTGRSPRYVRTVHRLGYAFDHEAIEDGAAPPRSGKVTGWIEWGSHRFPLCDGVHVIGRLPDAAVLVDSSTVSRRHATLTVSAEAAVLEDFGSHNGTFVGNTRITTPTPLRDGDVIRIGDVMLTYRAVGGGSSTMTYADQGR